MDVAARTGISRCAALHSGQSRSAGLRVAARAKRQWRLVQVVKGRSRIKSLIKRSCIKTRPHRRSPVASEQASPLPKHQNSERVSSNTAKMEARYREKTTLPSNCRATFCGKLSHVCTGGGGLRRSGEAKNALPLLSQRLNASSRRLSAICDLGQGDKAVW